MRHVLVNREAMLFNVTVDEAGWKKVRPHLTDFYRQKYRQDQQVQRLVFPEIFRLV